MAFRTICKIPRVITDFSDSSTHRMFLHKNRQYVIDNRRTFASKDPGPQAKPQDSCPPRSCNRKKKKSFWKNFFGQETPASPPPIECCQVKYYRDDMNKPDPDLSQFGGQAYKTCGCAYVVQRDMLPEESDELSQEDQRIRKIETHPLLQKMINEEIPSFKNQGQRMLDEADRRLHPLHAKLKNIPKKDFKDGTMIQTPCYKNLTGPVDVHDIPVNIKFNKALLDKKNLYSEYKRVEPPSQIINNIMEMKKNMKPTLENKPVKKVVPPCQPATKGGAVFETLYQKSGVL